MKWCFGWWILHVWSPFFELTLLIFGQAHLSSTCYEFFQPTHLKFALSLKGHMPLFEFARQKQQK